MQCYKTQFVLRPTSADDLPEIAAIERLSQINPWSQKMFADSLQAGDQICLLESIANAEIIGYVVFSIKAGECQILNLAVKESVRGRGYGRKLLQHIFQIVRCEIRKLGILSMPVFLEVRESNAIALALYRSLGFYEVGRRKNYYPKTANVPAESAIILKINI